MEIELAQETRDQIADLHEKKYGTRQIALRVGYSRHVVRSCLREMGYLKPSPPTQKKLDPFRQTIEAKVQKGLTTSRILREIKKQGYRGRRTILADHIRKLRASLDPQATPKKVKRRFETRPGEEMQIDWSPYWVTIGGATVRVHALGCLLASSRKLFLHPFRDERLTTLLEGLAMALEYFRGCTLRMVLDNMATAVLGRYAVNGKPVWHPRFLDFARHYGFEPFACAVRDPDRKGKKEKSFRLVWDDFLKGSEFESWDDLNRQARLWLDHTPETANLRVHGTTGLVPNEAWRTEQDFLIRLPHDRFPVYEESIRSVDQDSTLWIHSRAYTVPSGLASRSVLVHLFAQHFEVLDSHGHIAFSRRYVEPVDPRKLILDPAHYTTVPRRPRGEGRRLDQVFLKSFPTLAPLTTGLQTRMKSLAPIHIRALMRLSERYGEERFLQAATRAQDYRRFDASAVGRILEREHGPAEPDPVAPMGGAGAALVGDLEPPSLDAYKNLDTQDEEV